MNPLSESPLICKNDDCRGKDFEHMTGNKWKCVYCGTITQLKHKVVKKKVKPKKESIPQKDYSPLTLICEQCGETIDTISHPREEKGLNAKWIGHTCTKKSNLYT